MIAMLLRARELEPVRFAIVGGLTALIFVVLVWAAAQAGIGSVLVTAGAYGAAIAFQYLGHAKFTFRRKAAEAFQAGRFLAVNALGLAFSVLLVDFAAPNLSMSRSVAAFAVIVTLPILNFFAFKLWAFAGPADDAAPDASEAAMSHVYTDTFFTYIEQGSFRSARRIAPLMTDLLKPSSLVDVGCGRGAWAKVWGEAGPGEVHGVDGDYVDTQKLHIDPACFHKRDLSEPFDLGRRFDLVATLEVAEHLPPSTSAGFVDSLTRHGDQVLFSAAPPGQGGERHINERPLEFWRALFAERGYEVFDAVRPQIRDDAEIEPWYRYNTLLFVHRDAVERLPEAVKAAHVPQGCRLDDPSPPAWRLRRAVVRLMPRKMADWIAVANARRKAEAAA